ncbi:MAG: hypothetical protein COX43_00430 [Parcubacteria group bacterium CG23_combo_of_CG06-09_8_20_14_all_35_9]|nr:MAG: hypothetical protein COX43_00430 [Parcubacteria group bacterium CG23_combo_of_CG06-09_8_20_14_all_35_9]
MITRQGEKQTLVGSHFWGTYPNNYMKNVSKYPREFGLNSPKFASRGFTLVELLVVIAIVALLAVGIVVAIGHVQLKSRDAKRASDVTEIRKILALYSNTENGFPVNPNSGLDIKTCLTGTDDVSGLLIEKKAATRIPADPLWPEDTDKCYYYKSFDEGVSYELSYWLEGSSVGTPGSHAVGP